MSRSTTLSAHYRSELHAQGKSVCVQPNCYVQPVLSEHGNREMPSICFFAMRNIPPMEELAYDYGAGYIQTRLGGRCRCGDAICTFAGAPTPASSP